MKCEEYLELISEEVDGELEETRALPLMRHLVACNHCRTEYHETASLQTLLREDRLNSQIDVPIGFSSKVMENIASETSSEALIVEDLPVEKPSFSDVLSRLFPHPRPAMAWSLAASFLVVITFTIYYSGSVPDTKQAPQLANARVIDAKVLKTEKVTTAADKKDDFNYYVKQHAQALQRKADRSSIGHRKPNVIYASFNSNAGGSR